MSTRDTTFLEYVSYTCATNFVEFKEQRVPTRVAYHPCGTIQQLCQQQTNFSQALIRKYRCVKNNMTQNGRFLSFGDCPINFI